MEKKLIKIVPILMLLGLFVGAYINFNEISKSENYIYFSTLHGILTDYCIPIIVFCYVLKKDKSDYAKIGLYCIVLSIIANIIYMLTSHSMHYKIYSYSFKVKQTIGYAIDILKYQGILSLIESDNSNANTFKQYAIAVYALSEICYIIPIWAKIDASSVIYKIGGVLYNLFKVLVFAFLSTKLTSEDKKEDTIVEEGDIQSNQTRLTTADIISQSIAANNQLLEQQQLQQNNQMNMQSQMQQAPMQQAIPQQNMVNQQVQYPSYVEQQGQVPQNQNINNMQ